MLSHALFTTVEALGKCGIERIKEQGALARTGNAGDADKQAKGKGYINVLQVVFRSCLDNKGFFARLSPDGRQGD